MGNSGEATHEVGAKQQNELGLYDMSGNISEWCWDWRGSYSSSNQTNPRGPSSGSDRVCRGGNYYNEAEGCRVAYREKERQLLREQGIWPYDDLGLRIVRSKY